jgi:hypothetical protein
VDGSVKLVAAVKEVKLHHEEEANKVASELADERTGSGSGSTCRVKLAGWSRKRNLQKSQLTSSNNVVHNDDLLTRLDRVLLHLEVVGAVLLLVALGHALAGELALLPDGHEARAEPERQSRAKEEAAALEADDNVDAALLADGGVEGLCDLQLEGAHQVGEVGVVGEDGHDVLEEDARRGEVRELAQGGAQVYFKTGEFGGTGGIGGGESSLGAMVGSGGGVGLALGRVRGSGGSVGVLGRGRSVVRVAVRRVLAVGDGSATHIEGFGGRGKISGGTAVGIGCWAGGGRCCGAWAD